MDDKQQIEALYREMYEAMVRKDTATLNRVHADDFVLTHMTGMHQSQAGVYPVHCGRYTQLLFGPARTDGHHCQW